MNLTVIWTTTETPRADAKEFTQFHIEAGLHKVMAPLAATSVVIDVSDLAPGDYSGSVALINDDGSKQAAPPVPFNFTIPPLATAPVPSEVTVSLG